VGHVVKGEEGDLGDILEIRQAERAYLPLDDDTDDLADAMETASAWRTYIASKASMIKFTPATAVLIAWHNWGDGGPTVWGWASDLVD
jgi:hypothetical protein